VSFEPIPKHAALLRELSGADERWFVEELALDERAASVSFHVMARDQFSSLKQPSHAETALFTSMNAVAETIDVQTERLDALFARYAAKLGFRRPFLKMDTQGNDLAVARSAGDALAAFVGLQSELAFKRLYEHQCDYREAIDFYESAGFVLSSLVPNNAGHFPDLIEMDCVMYNMRHR
jgi:FkbM family methyltransferase